MADKYERGMGKSENEGVEKLEKVFYHWALPPQGELYKEQKLVCMVQRYGKGALTSQIKALVQDVTLRISHTGKLKTGDLR